MELGNLRQWKIESTTGLYIWSGKIRLATLKTTEPLQPLASEEPLTVNVFMATFLTLTVQGLKLFMCQEGGF